MRGAQTLHSRRGNTSPAQTRVKRTRCNNSAQTGVEGAQMVVEEEEEKEEEKEEKEENEEEEEEEEE
ncbi:hypothetical protein E2C01_094899 [Portunus trituberculatus]|uniref:Uncharacterized protein n=1 Tax=Portunus trituberculatus TaxID=210409 RepID=A0A5B7JYF0_PORTR|nr:hypothetical protein [Portunus trituberculatus]